MSRIDYIRIACLSGTMCLAGALGWLFYSWRFSPAAVMFVALLLIVPVRVQGACWREYLEGSRLLAEKDPAGAIGHFERFRSQLRDRPWLKYLSWFSWGAHTHNIEAMTLNNLGASHLALGDFAVARHWLEAARGLDPLSPLPYFNLALLERVQGNAEQSSRLFERARDLGFTGATSDQLLRQADELLARIEGHGARRST